MKNLSRRAGIMLAVLLAIPAFTVFAAAKRAAAPAPRAYVNDAAGVLDPGMTRKLDGILAGLDAKAKAQVAVLVINTLGGEDIEGYAVRTYKDWGIGDRKTNRGVLLLVAVQDRRARIEVGYGLEGILPDGLTGAIQDKYIIPYFRKGDYSQGVYQGALALAAVIAEDSGATLSEQPVQGRGERELPPLTSGQKVFAGLLLIAFILFSIRHPFLVYFLFSMLNSRGGRGGGFGGGGFGGFGGGMSGGGGSSRSW